MDIKKQTVSTPDNWLYRDYYNNDGTFQTRGFTKYAYLGVNDSNLPECTEADKQQWEAEHPEPEPEEPAAEPIEAMQQQEPTIDQPKASE